MTQLLFSLVQTVTTDRGHSLVCIPDRDTAQCELTKLRREYGERLTKAAIRKDRKGGTYTLRYYWPVRHAPRETTTVTLF